MAEPAGLGGNAVERPVAPQDRGGRGAGDRAHPPCGDRGAAQYAWAGHPMPKPAVRRPPMRSPVRNAPMQRPSQVNAPRNVPHRRRAKPAPPPRPAAMPRARPWTPPRPASRRNWRQRRKRLRESLGDLPDPLPRADRIEADVHRLRRQRDALGAVNLRAEEDAKTVQEEHDTLLHRERGPRGRDRQAAQRDRVAQQGRARAPADRLRAGQHELLEALHPSLRRWRSAAGPRGKRRPA
jgi:hypothetical protein